MRVGAVVLAAGRGRRMRGPLPKPLVEIEGTPMLERVLVAVSASRADSLRVVVRPGDDETPRLVERLGFVPVEAEDDREGRAASIRAGVRAVDPDADGILIALADQPFLEASDFDRLILAFAECPDGIVHASYAGQRGTPVLFSAHFTEELLALAGSSGGRELIQRHPEAVLSIELDPARGRDVDRPEDVG